MPNGPAPAAADRRGSRCTRPEHLGGATGPAAWRAGTVETGQNKSWQTSGPTVRSAVQHWQSHPTQQRNTLPAIRASPTPQRCHSLSQPVRRRQGTGLSIFTQFSPGRDPEPIADLWRNLQRFVITTFPPSQQHPSKRAVVIVIHPVSGRRRTLREDLNPRPPGSSAGAFLLVSRGQNVGNGPPHLLHLRPIRVTLGTPRRP
jgi:hypothetical protein